MKIAAIALSLLIPCSISFGQERPGAVRPAAQEGANARAPKPAPEFLPTREWAQLVENLVENCQGNLRCVVDSLQGILNDSKASPASKEAANHLMARAKNALEAQSAVKDEQVREQMNRSMREQLVKRRMAAAHAEGEQFRAAARRQLDERRIDQEQFQKRMAEIAESHRALEKRLQPRVVAPRNGDKRDEPRSR